MELNKFGHFNNMATLIFRDPKKDSKLKKDIIEQSQGFKQKYAISFVINIVQVIIILGLIARR